jgi:hypothetical protein
MLSTDTGSAPAPDDDAQVRREALAVLAEIGPHLLAASRALDGRSPRDALAALSAAAVVLRPYRT